MLEGWPTKVMGDMGGALQGKRKSGVPSRIVISEPKTLRTFHTQVLVVGQRKGRPGLDIIPTQGICSDEPYVNRFPCGRLWYLCTLSLTFLPF